jgi:hypothetical protein
MPLEKQNTVKFDPSKKVHRESVAAFMRRRSWSDSPIRFSHDPAYGSVADQVEKKMLAYYMEKEKLKIPASPNPAVMVGTIVDGVPAAKTMHVTVTDPAINKLLLPKSNKVVRLFKPSDSTIRVSVAANDNNA